MQACSSAIQQWSPTDMQGYGLFHADALTGEIANSEARLKLAVENIIARIMKDLRKADVDGQREMRGLCPDDRNYLNQMALRGQKLLPRSERLRDLRSDRALALSSLSCTDFVQEAELQSAAAIQAKLASLLCSWTAMVVHSNPATQAVRPARIT